MAVSCIHASYFLTGWLLILVSLETGASGTASNQAGAAEPGQALQAHDQVKLPRLLRHKAVLSPGRQIQQRLASDTNRSRPLSDANDTEPPEPGDLQGKLLVKSALKDAANRVWIEPVEPRVHNFTMQMLTHVETAYNRFLMSHEGHAPTDLLTPPYILETAVSLGIWAALAVTFALVYQGYRASFQSLLIRNEEKPHAVHLDKGTWAYGILEFPEPRMCLFVCLCPAVRWADTLRLAGMLSYITGVLVFTFSTFLAHLLPGVGFLLYVGVLTYYRQKLRANFHMSACKPATILEDCFMHWWCSPCAITQETNQIELAVHYGHPAAYGLTVPV
mmetsp:Transcript_23546/g.52126  ORF Transcript_23546/g.52126 Transcript_23546/m.52126 type:complete len:333 (+) Transcript_23546:57-1055(+)